MREYLMEDPRERNRLAAKVDAVAWADSVAPWLEVVNAKRVLDVGCGPGTLACALADRLSGSRVVGVDLSAARFAVTQHERVEFQEARIEKLPFAAGEFDAAVARLLFQFLPDRPAALSELYRVLRPDGRMIIQDLDGQLTWHDGMAQDLEDAARHVVAHLGSTGFDPFVGRRLFRLVRDAGFRCEEVRVEPYHAIFGAAREDELQLWQTKLSIAMPHIVSALGGHAAAREFANRYLAHLANPDTVTYSVMFTVIATRPSP